MNKGYWYNNKIKDLETGHLINAISFIHNGSYTQEFKPVKIKEILDELHLRDLEYGINTYTLGEFMTPKNHARQQSNSFNFLDTVRIIARYYNHPVIDDLRDYALKWTELSHLYYKVDKNRASKRIDFNEAYDNYNLKEYENILDYI